MITEVPFQIEAAAGWPIRGEVRHLERDGAEGLVIISHGFKGFKDWGGFPYLARRLAERGFTAVSFNFSGSGIGAIPTEFTELDLFRANTLTREIQDLQAVLDAATGGGLAGVPDRFERRPALLGHSRGGVVSLAVANHRPQVGRVVTWAGVGSLEARFPRETRVEWRRRGFLQVVNTRTGQILEMGLDALDDLEAHMAEYDPVRLARDLGRPLLIVHGTDDPTVPLSEGRAIFSAAPPDLVRFLGVEGAGHTFGVVHPFQGTTPHFELALDETLEFLSEADPPSGR